jgi:Tfp pilus assembly protein PilX
MKMIRNQKGVALMIVLASILIITTIAVEFA